jgi:hypothetical protein
MYDQLVALLVVEYPVDVAPFAITQTCVGNVKELGVNGMRERNVLWAAIIATIEFFLSPQLSGSFHSRDPCALTARYASRSPGTPPSPRPCQTIPLVCRGRSAGRIRPALHTSLWLNLGHEKRAQKMLAAPRVGKANDDGGVKVIIANAAVSVLQR